MWNSFTDARFPGILFSLAAQLPSLVMPYIVLKQFLKHALGDLKARDALVTEGAWGEVTLQPGLQQCERDCKAVTA